MGKEKPRRYEVVLTRFDISWGNKNRPLWCPNSNCAMIAGWKASVGWCSGIYLRGNDLDIVHFCQVMPDESRQAGEIAEIMMKPDEALMMAADLTRVCEFIFARNSQYKEDADRLHRKNLKKRQRGKAKGDLTKDSKCKG